MSLETGGFIVPSSAPREGCVTISDGTSIDATIESLIALSSARSPSSGFLSSGSSSADESSTLHFSPPPVITQAGDVSTMSDDEPMSVDPVSPDHFTTI